MGYVYTWFIENCIYCTYGNGEEFLSPEFTAEDLEDTVWCLKLFPKGLTEQYKGAFSLYLYRRDDDGPEELPLEYELSILAADGATLKSLKCEYTFKKGFSDGIPQFLTMNDILLKGKTSYFLEENVRLRCKMGRGGGDIHSFTEINARTRIGIEHISFLHVVENFSAIAPKQKKIIHIRSLSKNGLALSCTLFYIAGPFCQGKIIVEILPSGTDKILSKCKLSLLDGFGEKLKCGEADNRFNATRKGIQKMPLSFLRRQEILDRRHEYFPDDKLSLLCECIFSTGVEYEKIEKILYLKPFVALNERNEKDQNSDTYEKELSNSNSVLDDFKEMYKNEFLTDITIKTKTKSYPAHKIVLSARSPVFRAMMANDMKEKNSNIIQVDDIEDDTVQEFLLFLYSDNIEALQWESAKKLYYAADKYAVEKLKVICSSFLVDNVSASTASELLLFADTHNDSRLKKDVEDFIFKNERQVYGSEEWKNLVEINPTLVSKTMLLMHERKI